LPIALSFTFVGPTSHIPSFGTQEPPSARPTIWWPKQIPAIDLVEPKKITDNKTAKNGTKGNKDKGNEKRGMMYQ
jgi:hypothetical protein